MIAVFTICHNYSYLQSAELIPENKIVFS